MILDFTGLKIPRDYNMEMEKPRYGRNMILLNSQKYWLCGIRNGVDQFVTMKIHVLKSLLIRATLLEYLFLGIAKVFAYCLWEDI